MYVLLVHEGGYLPGVVGGSERTIESLCLALRERGHEVAVLLLSRHRPGHWRDCIAGLLRPLSMQTDRSRGYAVHRARNTAVLRAQRRAIENLAPDVAALVITKGRLMRLAEPLSRRGMTVLAYLHSHPLPAVLPKTIRYLAPSQWLLQRCREAGLPSVTVLHPIVEPERYSVTGPGAVATMVGATWAKGLDTLLEVAELCPDIRFVVYQTWAPPEVPLAKRLAGLANVELRQALPDFRVALAETRLLLLPSRMETWGRAVTEAQVSGIPALARAVGGLPESVGEGGLLLPPDAPAADWAAALRDLWDHASRYARLSERSRAMAARPELRKDTLVDAFLAAVEQARNLPAVPASGSEERCSAEPASH